jgi:transposase
MDREFLAARLAAGLSFEQIGREVGLHLATVAYWAKKHGLRSAGADKFAPRGEPDRKLMEELATGGATLDQMADALDRSIATVRYWLRKWDITRPERVARFEPGTAPQDVDRYCRKHGITRFRLETRGYYRCLLCRQERVSDWRRRIKRKLIAEAGGGCQLCGYDSCAAALQFHHLDPKEKSFPISHDGVARSIARARQEAAKCVLLCANCHAEVEVGHTVLDIGP